LARKFFLFALLLLLLTGAFAPAAMAVSESRIIFTDAAQKVSLPVYYPTFIPEGFNYDHTRSQVSAPGNQYHIYFTGPESEIMVGGGKGDIGATSDVKTLDIGGLEVSTGRQGDILVAWWNADDYNYAIIARGMDRDQLELIVNSITLATGNLPKTGVDSRWFAFAFILIAIGLALVVFNPKPGTGK